MNRQRHDDESYVEYRAAQRDEAARLRVKLQGVYLGGPYGGMSVSEVRRKIREGANDLTPFEIAHAWVKAGFTALFGGKNHDYTKGNRK